MIPEIRAAARSATYQWAVSYSQKTAGRYLFLADFLPY
jgi:hypothetical protein